jgi:hypothetical protein
MRETPVGMKCPDCARLPRRATRTGNPRYYVRAGVATGLLSVVCGAALIFLPIRWLGFIAPVLIGALVGEATSRAASKIATRSLRIQTGLLTAAGLTLGAFLTGIPLVLLISSSQWLFSTLIASGFAVLLVGR